jgi:hypothetical protein
MCPVSGSSDDCVEKDGTFYITKDATYVDGIFFRLFCPTNPTLMCKPVPISVTMCKAAINI